MCLCVCINFLFFSYPLLHLHLTSLPSNPFTFRPPSFFIIHSPFTLPSLLYHNHLNPSPFTLPPSLSPIPSSFPPSLSSSSASLSSLLRLHPFASRKLSPAAIASGPRQDQRPCQACREHRHRHFNIHGDTCACSVSNARTSSPPPPSMRFIHNSKQNTRRNRENAFDDDDSTGGKFEWVPTGELT